MPLAALCAARSPWRCRPSAPARHTQESDVLEVPVLDVLNDDFLCWLNLKHLEDKAEEGRGLAATPKRAPCSAQLGRPLNQALRCQRKALLLPVRGLVYLLADDVLHQVLRAQSSTHPRTRTETPAHRSAMRCAYPCCQAYSSGLTALLTCGLVPWMAYASLSVRFAILQSARARDQLAARSLKHTAQPGVSRGCLRSCLRPGDCP